MKNAFSSYLYYDESRDDGIVPYLSCADFAGLACEKTSFCNRDGHTVAVFLYEYPGHAKKAPVLFLPGVAPGHKAYLREIETICRAGYRVTTFDYAGCGESDGDGYESLYAPALDVLEWLSVNPVPDETVVIGHSLGGFTAYNVLAETPRLKKAVILSGFPTVGWRIKLFDNAEEIRAFETRYGGGLAARDMLAWLRRTDDKLLLIHSADDDVIPFDVSTGWVQKNADNPNISYLVTDHRGHNPNYTDAALRYLYDVFGTYLARVADGTLDTFEKKKAFMADKSAMDMTHQDKAIWETVFAFADRV